MIQIHKPDEAPEILANEGQAAQAEIRAVYDRGVREFDFDRNRKIYADETVKTALLDAQHGKCCYCEVKFSFSDTKKTQ